MNWIIAICILTTIINILCIYRSYKIYLRKEKFRISNLLITGTATIDLSKVVAIINNNSSILFIFKAGNKISINIDENDIEKYYKQYSGIWFNWTEQTIK